jgi:hypothetical protein
MVLVVVFWAFFSASDKLGVNERFQSKVQKEDVINTLRERHANIEWTGEVFRVKPMKLFRLNLSTLSASTNIATANIQVRRYETVHTIKLRVSETPVQTPSLTPQLVMARLTEKIQQSESRLNNKDTEIIEKIQQSESRLNNKGTEIIEKIQQSESRLNNKNTEIIEKIQQSESRLNNKNTEIIEKIQQSETRLNSSMIPMKNKLDTLPGSTDAKIQASETHLENLISPMKTKLATLPAWPDGSYCILKKGACPPGFTKHSVGLLNIQVSHSMLWLYQSIGDSRITCHNSDCSHGNLYLNACCH